MEIDMDKYDIKNVELSTIFLHYTNIKNVDSILKNGLEPRVGKSSKVIEKNKKIFFSIGDKGSLVIMDSWIKWIIAKPKSDFIYWIGAYLLKTRFFPKIVHKTIMTYNNKNQNKRTWAYKKMKEILEESVYLILKLEESVDFSFNDIDEVKTLSNYPRQYIEDMYAYNSDPCNPKMEYWNMHTFNDKVIKPNKISLLTYQNKSDASVIVKYLIETNLDFVEENLSTLYEYYRYHYIENKD